MNNRFLNGTRKHILKAIPRLEMDRLSNVGVANQNGARLGKACEELNINVYTYED